MVIFGPGAQEPSPPSGECDPASSTAVTLSELMPQRSRLQRQSAPLPAQPTEWAAQPGGIPGWGGPRRQLPAGCQAGSGGPQASLPPTVLSHHPVKIVHRDMHGPP